MLKSRRQGSKQSLGDLEGVRSPIAFLSAGMKPRLLRSAMRSKALSRSSRLAHSLLRFSDFPKYPFRIHFDSTVESPESSFQTPCSLRRQVVVGANFARTLGITSKSFFKGGQSTCTNRQRLWSAVALKGGRSLLARRLPTLLVTRTWCPLRRRMRL